MRDSVQPHDDLLERGHFEGPLRDLRLVEDVGVITYLRLAADVAELDAAAL